VLALLELAENAGFLAFPLETAESILEGLVFLDFDQWHVGDTSFRLRIARKDRCRIQGRGPAYPVFAVITSIDP
jgi:hypothetical protein